MKAPCDVSVKVKYYLNLKTVFIDFSLTIAICTLISVIITLISPDKHFLKNFVLSQSFGINICSLVLLLMWLFKPQTWMPLLLVIIAAVCTGATAGLYLGITILENILHIPLNWPVDVFVKTIVVAMIFSACFIYVFICQVKTKAP